MAPKKYYAVARGGKPGIYTSWFGPEGAQEQIRGFSGALYRGFSSLAEARRWLDNPVTIKSPFGKASSSAPSPTAMSPGKTIIYTDGGCRGNPGPGGYGAIIIEGGKRLEVAEGFQLTTNNRMELMACIAALKALQTAAEATLHSDSRYVVNGITKGWARKWRTNDWMRTKTEAAENSDLWAQLLELCDRHRVTFVWVPGHAGQRENEHCDQLATAAAGGTNLKEDFGYARGRIQTSGN